MTLINIESLQTPIPPDRFSLFELGFRPFFLAAGLLAIGLMLWWLAALLSLVEVNTYYDSFTWHSHEMVFGFAVAVIAGFLLTAVRNWTSVQTLKGPALAAMLMLWLLARLLPLFGNGIPTWLIAVVDLAFLPLLALSLAIAILRANKRPQLVFVALLSVLFIANGLVHLQMLDINEASAQLGIQLGINTIVLIIIIMAGRVLPMFIERGAPGAKPCKWPWLEKTVITLMVVLMIVELVYPVAWLIAILAGVAAVMHGLRLWGWYSKQVWSVPLLWVLHLGYGWLVLGFAFKAMAMLELVSAMLADHALAAAIGVLCLGMMSRVALGHTGRSLTAAPLMTWAFAFINLAMCVRVFVPMFIPAWATSATLTSGLVWVIAYTMFVVVYTPILIKARVDGQPG